MGHAHLLRHILLVTLVTGGVFLNTLDNRPTNWDDPALFANPHYRGLTIENLSHALSFHRGATFQPLRDISYMLDFSFWQTPRGLIFGLHLHNLLLYLGMVLAGLLFLRLLLRALDMEAGRADFLAAVASLIYAVHPVHVESVAWLYARKEPLLGLFTFLCLWVFLKARLEKRGAWYAASAAAMILAILAKPTAVVLPAVILALDLIIRRQRREPIPWITGGIFLLPLAGFAAWQAIRLLGMLQSSGGVLPYHGGSFATNLLAASQIFAAYFKLAGFTLNYAADYPLRLYVSPAQWQTWAFILLNAAVIAGAIWSFFKGRYLFAFFVFWHYIFILPASNLIPISQVLADRYALLPSLSWCVLLGYGLTSLRFLRINPSGNLISPAFPRLLAYGLTAAVVAGYAAMTVRQNDVWQDGQTLWEHNVALYPNSFPGNVNLSILYLNQGRYAEAERLCTNALANLAQANLIGSAHMALNNLAAAQAGQGNYAAAMRNFAQVLKRDPTLPQARLGMANCAWQMQDYAGAYAQYRFIVEHLAITPPRVRAECLYRAGYAAWKLGLSAEAPTYLRQSIQADKDNPNLLRKLAETYTSMGLSEEAADLCRPPRENASPGSFSPRGSRPTLPRLR